MRPCFEKLLAAPVDFDALAAVAAGQADTVLAAWPVDAALLVVPAAQPVDAAPRPVDAAPRMVPPAGWSNEGGRMIDTFP